MSLNTQIKKLKNSTSEHGKFRQNQVLLIKINSSSMHVVSMLTMNIMPGKRRFSHYLPGDSTVFPKI